MRGSDSTADLNEWLQFITHLLMVGATVCPPTWLGWDVERQEWAWEDTKNLSWRFWLISLLMMWILSLPPRCFVVDCPPVCRSWSKQLTQTNLPLANRTRTCSSWAQAHRPRRWRVPSTERLPKRLQRPWGSCLLINLPRSLDLIFVMGFRF